MKHLILLSVILPGFLRPLAYCQQKDSPFDFTINGQLIGRDTGRVVIWYEDPTNKTLWDTLLLEKGRFQATGRIRAACEAYIWTNPQNRSFDDESVIRFILQPGNITVTKTYGKPGSIITGSAAQVEKDRWDKEQLPLTTAEATRRTRAAALQDLDKKAVQPQYEEQITALYRQADSLRDARFRMDIDYVATHPHTHLGALLLYKRRRNLPVDSVQALYNNLADSVKNSSLGYQVLLHVYPLTNDSQFRRKNPLLGETFGQQLAAIRSLHDFTLHDNNGKPQSLSAFRGKYLVIDVWASWCKPCIKNIPAWNQHIKSYDPARIQFVSVSFDTEPESWQKALSQYKPGGLQLVEPGNFTSLFAMYCKALFAPTYLIADPDGRIIHFQAPHPSEPAFEALLDGLVKKRN